MEKTTGVVFRKVLVADRVGGMDLYIADNEDQYKLRRGNLNDPSAVEGVAYDIEWSPSRYKEKDYRMISKITPVDDPFADTLTGALPQASKPSLSTGPNNGAPSQKDVYIFAQVALKTAFDFYGREIDCVSRTDDAFGLADRMLEWILGKGPDRVS